VLNKFSLGYENEKYRRGNQSVAAKLAYAYMEMDSQKPTQYKTNLSV
jgi:hypothetical protein